MALNPPNPPFIKGGQFNLKLVLLTGIFCSIVWTPVLLSQTFSFYHYTSSEGLASSSVYDLIQDRNGYMWFATANGVSKFDGHRFINYTTSDGLNSSNITNLIEGTNGELYFGNHDKGFNIYAGSKIVNYSNPTEQNLLFRGMFMDGVQLYSYYANNVSIVNSENTINLFKGYHPDTILINKMVRISDGTILAATSKGLYKFENRDLKKINISGLDRQEIYWLSGAQDNNIVLGANGKIYEIKNNTVVRTIEVNLFEKNNVIRVLKDTKGNIWFSIMSRGFYFIEAGTNRIADIGKKMGLENAMVNNFLEDNEGNIWASTFGDGVFCLNNLSLFSYSQKDGLSNNKVLAIEKDHAGRMLVGTHDGLNVLDSARFNIIISKTGSAVDYTYIYDINCINDTVYVSASYHNSIYFIRQSYKNDRFCFFNSSAFCITKDGRFINGFWNNAIYIQRYPPKTVYGEVAYLFGDTKTVNKVHNIFEDERNNLWLGTSLGLCKMTPSTRGQKTFFPQNEILSTTVRYIIQDRKGKIWFAGDKGIASYDLNDSVITNFPKINEHDMSSSNTLSVDKHNRLWIGSMNGLFILEKDSVKILNTETGLPSNEIFSLYYDSTNNNMWIGSAKGLSSLDINEFDNKKILPVNVQLKNIKTEDSVYTNFDNINFEPDANNIYIDFTAINYSSPASVKYQYKLLEDSFGEDEWLALPDDFINFISLKRGDYKLAIRGKTINSSWGTPKLISFTVLPYFTETFTLRASVIGLLLIGIVFVAVKRIRYVKAKSVEKIALNNQINDLKHSALSAMMNPHFIFNSLNSVQYLINIDRKKEANDYISLMARLIRMNLETASESYISLDEEIKRLDLYLQIEKLRFSEKFNYEIETGSGVEPNTVMLPNMIIQPFVENSIWHGIMPSGRERFIKLSFNFENVSVDNNSFKFFVIRITDNGIGLTESQKNKKDGHISKGIQIIQERLILLSKESNMPQPIIQDLNIKNKNTQGTEVVLSIPPELYKVINN